MNHSQSMKSTLFASLLLLAGTSFALADSGSTEKPASKPYLSLSSNAFEEVEQDLVMVTLSKDIRGAKETELKQQLNEALNTVKEKAKAYDSIELQSGRYNVWMAMQPNTKDKNKAKDQEWMAHADILLRSQQFDEVSKLIHEVDEAMNLSHIQFSLSTAKRQEVEQKLRAKAIDSFKEKAKATAEEFGYQDYELAIVRLEDSSQSDRLHPQPRMMAMAANSDSSATPIEGGKEEVTVTVTGDVSLKERIE